MRKNIHKWCHVPVGGLSRIHHESKFGTIKEVEEIQHVLRVIRDESGDIY